MSDSSQRDQMRSVNVGRIMMILVGLSLILIGSLFIVLMARSYLRAKEMRDWPVVECVILESAVEERQHDPYSPIEFGHLISYGYEWQGQSHTGKRISLRGEKWSSKRQEAEESLSEYPLGSIQQCHVDPDQPTQAVLELDSLAPLYSIWFPALFVVGGAGILISSMRGLRKAR